MRVDVAHRLEVQFENSEEIRATLFEEKRRDPLSMVHLSLVHSWPSDLTATLSPPADAAPVQLPVREITYRERVVIPAVYFPGRTALRLVAVPFALAGDIVMLCATFGMWAHPANAMREKVREETDCGREAGSGKKDQ